MAIGKVEVNNIATSKVKFRESPHGKLKGTVKENKRGYRLNAYHFSSWSQPMKVLSDVSVSRNSYKTVSNVYENSYIYNFA